jgi:hypothetical protein
MVDLSSLFGVSYVLLWILVVGQSFMLFVLLRTIGHLLLNDQPIGVREGVEVGKKLPDVQATTAAGPGLLHELLPSRPYAAVVFTTPGCGYCPGAVEAVRHAVAEFPWLGATVLVRGDELNGYAEVAEWGSVATIAADAAEQLNLRATPFVMVVDGSAKVVAKGVVNDETHLATLIEATEKAMADPAPMTRG